jgi:hypothetical protein
MYTSLAEGLTFNTVQSVSRNALGYGTRITYWLELLIKTQYFSTVCMTLSVPLVTRSESAAARHLRLWVRIPPVAWRSVRCKCCVLSGRGLCVWLITRPEESFRLWCVVVCDLETSWMRRPWPTGGCCAKRKKRYDSVWFDTWLQTFRKNMLTHLYAWIPLHKICCPNCLPEVLFNRTCWLPV